MSSINLLDESALRLGRTRVGGRGLQTRCINIDATTGTNVVNRATRSICWMMARNERSVACWKAGGANALATIVQALSNFAAFALLARLSEDLIPWSDMNYYRTANGTWGSHHWPVEFGQRTPNPRKLKINNLMGLVDFGLASSLQYQMKIKIKYTGSRHTKVVAVMGKVASSFFFLLGINSDVSSSTLFFLSVEASYFSQYTALHQFFNRLYWKHLPSRIIALSIIAELSRPYLKFPLRICHRQPGVSYTVLK
jgi:hypothetical protein